MHQFLSLPGFDGFAELSKVVLLLAGTKQPRQYFDGIRVLPLGRGGLLARESQRVSNV